MATIHVDIVSAEGSIYSGEATMVIAPAEMGEVGIAPRHTPFLTRLKAGEIRVRLPDSTETKVFVSGGILEVQPALVTIMADTAVRAKDYDEAAALAARQRAEAALAHAKSEIDMARAQVELSQISALLSFLQKVNKH